jgi:hypothetical protein
MEHNALLNRKLFFADARLMMQQTERLRTERKRWEIDARFEHQSISP